MKTISGLLIPALCGACVLTSIQNADAASSSTTGASPAGQTSVASPASTPPLTRAEALAVISGAITYQAHPPLGADGDTVPPKMMMPDFDMAAPPPAPRTETKPDAPSPGLVWVAGHYMPVKGEWRWVQGEWAVPAVPISVWIKARYDEEKKHWYPGYWQPDRATSPAPPAPTANGGKAAVKPNNGY